MGDAGTRELSDLDMRECLFTDYVGRVTDGHEPRWPWSGRLLDASGRSSQPHLDRRRRPAVRLRGPAPGLRGGRLGRSRAARGGGAARLDARDLGLATRLAYGAVQRRATLDHVIAALAGRGLDRLEPAVVAALRLGTFQLAYLDRVPAHAAVGESVAARQGGLARRRRARQRRPAARRPRGARAGRGAARGHAAGRRAAPLASRVDRRAVVGDARARRRARADGRRQRAGRARAARQHAAHDRRGARRPAAGPEPRRAGPAGGAGARRRPSTPTARRSGGRACSCRSRARR